jgi:hypothetical protein
MKMISMPNRVGFAILLFSVAVAAHARGGVVPRPDPSIPHSISVSSADPVDTGAATAGTHADALQVESATPASGKTRAQVQAELLQAGEAGLLPVNPYDYPPSAATRARNRAHFLQLEQVWRSEGIIPAVN